MSFWKYLTRGVARRFVAFWNPIRRFVGATFTLIGRVIMNFWNRIRTAVSGFFAKPAVKDNLKALGVSAGWVFGGAIVVWFFFTLFFGIALPIFWGPVLALLTLGTLTLCFYRRKTTEAKAFYAWVVNTGWPTTVKNKYVVFPTLLGIPIAIYLWLKIGGSGARAVYQNELFWGVLAGIIIVTIIWNSGKLGKVVSTMVIVLIVFGLTCLSPWFNAVITPRIEWIKETLEPEKPTINQTYIHRIGSAEPPQINYNNSDMDRMVKHLTKIGYPYPDRVRNQMVPVKNGTICPTAEEVHRVWQRGQVRRVLVELRPGCDLEITSGRRESSGKLESIRAQVSAGVLGDEFGRGCAVIVHIRTPTTDLEKAHPEPDQICANKEKAMRYPQWVKYYYDPKATSNIIVYFDRDRGV